MAAAPSPRRTLSAVERWNDLDDVPTDLSGTVVTLGNFDGVHAGHRAVLTRVVERARALGCRSVAITFDPHPVQVLFPDRAPELVTSLDMAGCSLTVMWLDDELERYWTAPADTPAYKKGAAELPAAAGERRTDGDVETATATPQLAALSDDEGRNGGRLVARAFEAMAEMLADAEEELGRIDAIAGDGDHGRGMVKGSSAARERRGEGGRRRCGPGLGAHRCG